MVKYKCYVDTNIFLDFIRKRDEKSIELFKKIKELNLELITSYFTYLEIFDKEAEDYYIRREFNNKKTFGEIRRNIYDRNLKESELKEVIETTTERIYDPKIGKIEFPLFYLNDDGWGLAMDLMGEINLNSGDAVHLATALESNCEFLITKDKAFRKNAKEKIKCVTPKEILNPTFFPSKKK